MYLVISDFYLEAGNILILMQEGDILLRIKDETDLIKDIVRVHHYYNQPIEFIYLHVRNTLRNSLSLKGLEVVQIQSLKITTKRTASQIPDLVINQLRKKHHGILVWPSLDLFLPCSQHYASRSPNSKKYCRTN